MRPNHEILDDINPYSSHDVERWSESPTGRQTLTRVLSRTADSATAFNQREERRRRPWLVTATAAAAVLALAIPAALVMRSQDGVSPGGGSIPFDGLWILDSFTANGEFTTVEIGVNSTELPFIEFGPQVSGDTGCNNFSVSETNFTLESGTLTLSDILVTDMLCDNAAGTGLMFAPSVFREAMTARSEIAVSIVGDNMQWIVAGDARLFFVREERGMRLTPEETRQVPMWVNQLGLAQFHPAVWRDRFDRMCGEGVWNPDAALRLSAEFINTDLEAGASVRIETAGPPVVEDGALILWVMAASTCPGSFPAGAIEQGAPDLGGGSTSPPTSGSEVSGLPPILLGASHLWPEEPFVGQPSDVAAAFAAEVLGWDSPSVNADPRADPTGDVWVRIAQEGVAELVDVLTVPAPTGGRTLSQIGVPWAKGVSVDTLGTGQPGSRIGLIRVRDAQVAEVAIRLGDGSQVIVMADREDIGSGWLEVPGIPDPREIRSVLIRYLDAENRVIAATGESF